MSDSPLPPTLQRRHPLLLVLVCLILGPAAIMLWLGRWKFAVLYFVLTLIVFFVFFTLGQSGALDWLVSMQLPIIVVTLIALLPLYLAGLLHGLKLNKQSIALPWYARWYLALPAVIALNVPISLAREQVFQSVNLPSASMAPYFMPGDYAFVARQAYGPNDLPAYGDAVAFTKSVDGQEIMYAKRIVGLPGDGIQVIKGVLHINGAPVKREALPKSSNPEFAQSTLYRETLPSGQSHVIAEFEDTGPGDDTEFFQVPEGHYFVMGDNRDNSQDSRYADTSFVPYSSILGHIGKPWWNAAGFELGGRP